MSNTTEVRELSAEEIDAVSGGIVALIGGAIAFGLIAKGMKSLKDYVESNPVKAAADAAISVVQRPK